MQTENDVRNRISAVFAEFGETQNKLAGGDSATQKRLNRQLSDNGAAITVDTLLLLSGVTALIAKHLIISPKMGFFYCAKPLKMGEMWCVLVGLGAKISKFSANF